MQVTFEKMVLCIEQQQQRHQFSISKLILPYIWKFCSKFSSNLEARQQWRKFFYSNVGGLSDGPPELNTDKRASYDNLECIYDNCRRRRPPLYLDFDKIMPPFLHTCHILERGCKIFIMYFAIYFCSRNLLLMWRSCVIRQTKLLWPCFFTE